MSEIGLDINIRLSLNEGDVTEFDRFRLDLHKSLKEAGYGSCGEHELTATGFFTFDCDLTNLHDGLSLLREVCKAMKPRPELDVTLVGTDKWPIEVFPNNALPEFLEGLEPKKPK
ncbi:MAG TPA: hypothetical protein VNO50_22310 [Pyrinomonadaceae bacterium]|nr:hypothetical protein [Pyrinomonadaceae bacterium]